LEVSSIRRSSAAASLSRERGRASEVSVPDI
jgi:hypothetical protein